LDDFHNPPAIDAAPAARLVESIHFSSGSGRAEMLEFLAKQERAC